MNACVTIFKQYSSKGEYIHISNKKMNIECLIEICGILDVIYNSLSHI